jgi:hypothetical protein
MINKEQLPKAYKECIEILKYIPKEEYNKIPSYIIDKLKREMDSEYFYKVTHFEDFENQEMLEETKTILAVLFRDYWATEQQREKIKAKENYDIQLLEEEKRKKYNPDDIFKSNQIKLEKNANENSHEETQLIEYKESIFTKIKNIILKIFH